MKLQILNENIFEMEGPRLVSSNLINKAARLMHLNVSISSTCEYNLCLCFKMELL